MSYILLIRLIRISICSNYLSRLSYTLNQKPPTYTPITVTNLRSMTLRILKKIIWAIAGECQDRWGGIRNGRWSPTWRWKFEGRGRTNYILNCWRTEYSSWRSRSKLWRKTPKNDPYITIILPPPTEKFLTFNLTPAAYIIIPLYPRTSNH